MSTNEVQDEKINQLESGQNDLRLMFAEQQKVIEGLQKEKVSWEHFYWIVGSIITLQLGMWGFAISKLDNIDSSVVSVQKDVSFIQGQFNK
jgi:hypothetical protein